MTAPDLAALESAAQWHDKQAVSCKIGTTGAALSYKLGRTRMAAEHRQRAAAIRSAIEWIRSDNDRVAEEREACARVIELLAPGELKELLASTIRARGEQPSGIPYLGGFQPCGPQCRYPHKCASIGCEKKR